MKIKIKRAQIKRNSTHLAGLARVLVRDAQRSAQLRQLVVGQAVHVLDQRLLAWRGGTFRGEKKTKKSNNKNSKIIIL